MTTSINSLPIGPQLSENINLNANELNIKVENQVANLAEQRNSQIYNPQIPQQEQNHITTDNTNENTSIQNQNLNDFVTGIQKASASGMLTLPSRDIPQDNVHITQDEQIKPNYIPNEAIDDYIKNTETKNEIIEENNNKEKNNSFYDKLYNNIHTPLLISLLYFLSTLPIINRAIYKFLPNLFKKDGNNNLIGHIIKSILFGIVYYISITGIKQLSL